MKKNIENILDRILDSKPAPYAVAIGFWAALLAGVVFAGKVAADRGHFRASAHPFEVLIRDLEVTLDIVEGEDRRRVFHGHYKDVKKAKDLEGILRGYRPSRVLVKIDEEESWVRMEAVRASNPDWMNYPVDALHRLKVVIVDERGSHTLLDSGTPVTEEAFFGLLEQAKKWEEAVTIRVSADLVFGEEGSEEGSEVVFTALR